MLEIMPQTAADLLVVSASDKLTADDYENTFIPALTTMIAEHGCINTVIVFEHSFSGWEPGAMWEDAKFGLKHRSDFNRIALVSNIRWINWATKVAGLFVTGEVATFEPDQLEQALAWISSD